MTKSFFVCSCRASLLAAASLLAIVARDASGQETLSPLQQPVEKLPRFTVELIVFTYDETTSGSSEIFVPDRPPLGEYLEEDPEQTPDPEHVFGDAPAASGKPPADGPTPGEPSLDGEQAPAEIPAEITGFDENLADIPLRARIELQLLEPEQYTMDEIYEKLVNLDAYQPIMRTAWTQTTTAEELSPAIRLRALGDPPLGLEGTVKLYQGRFVHLGLDLALDAEGRDGRGSDDAEPYDARKSATDEAIGYYGDRGYTETDGLWPQPVRYRISEVRIMKTGTIRYYDHPHFGVIAKLTEVPETDPADEGSDPVPTNALAGED